MPVQPGAELPETVADSNPPSLITFTVPPPPPPLAETVRDTVDVFVNPPPVPVMVTGVVPVVALALAENVTVEEPLPGAATEVGLKLAVTPLGNPLAESDIAELNPPETAVLTVPEEDEFCVTDCVADALNV